MHGGAGAFGDDLRAHEAAYRDALTEALDSAAAALDGGGDAVAAVRAAVIVLESSPLFNAGYGAALCADGSVELSAALMRGSDRGAGAVAAITRTRHPILAAGALLDAPQVLMLGARADDYAAAHGAEQWEPHQFVTERQVTRLAERAAGAASPERAAGAGFPERAAGPGSPERAAGPGSPERAAGPGSPEQGTVGAVCLDSAQTLAAATSTGGLLGQAPGRVGDTPLIGAGTWADRQVAASCTGEGEAFIRAGAARLLAALVEQGMALDAAAERVLDEVRGLGGGGGLIAVDASGQLAMPFSTGAMPRGVWRADGGSKVEIR